MMYGRTVNHLHNVSSANHHLHLRCIFVRVYAPLSKSIKFIGRLALASGV
jgi:hypothetical protein